MATQTLQDGTAETAVLHPDGSVGVTVTDPKTGNRTHYDSARISQHGMPKFKPHWIELALPIAAVVLIVAGMFVAAYCGR